MKTLWYFVQSYKQRRREVSTDNDQYYLQACIDCLKKLRGWGLLDSCVKSVEIHMRPFGCGCDGPEVVPPFTPECLCSPSGQTALNTQHALDFTATSPTGQGSGGYRWAYLPKDYRKYLRIGIICNGKLINFDLNDDIGLQPGRGGMLGGNGPCNNQQISKIISNCCQSDGGGSEWTSWMYPIFGQPWSYSYTVGSYGVGPGFYKGGYKIDTARNIIIFDPCVPLDSFVLEYVGDFTTDAGNALIPPNIEDLGLLQNYIYYLEKYFDDRVPLNTKNMAWSTFYQGVQDLNSNKNSFNYHEWVQLIRSFTYMGVKA